MQLDGRSLAGTEISADVCIIGAGAAGITIAMELTGTPLSVLLLESGGMDLDAETQQLAQGDITGLGTFPLVASRLRCFGGSTGHWGGRCRPFDELDFAERPWVPHSGWPITRSDLETHYQRAQEILQLGPFDYEPRSWDLQDSPPLKLPGNSVGTRLLQLSPPTRFGIRYRDAILSAPNVRLCLHSNVVQIVPEPSGKQIASLEVATLTGKRFTVRARTYVLATGGIENARLLLASNRVMPAGVGNDHDLVGRFYSDHINLDTAGVFPLQPNAAAFALYQQDSRARMRRYLGGSGRPVPVLGLLDLSAETQKRERTLNYMAELAQTDWDDYFLHAGRFDAETQTSDGSFSQRIDEAREILATLWHNLSDAVSRAFQDKSTHSVFYRILTLQEQAPNPESRVLLTTRKDRLGMPIASLRWQLTDLDRHTIRVAVKEIASTFGAAGLARLKATFDLDAPAWPIHMQSSWHHCGTTRMHADPSRGVVDADCRVHGLSNLFIAGSSVFPTNGSANPTLTLVALSVRLAGHLKRSST